MLQSSLVNAETGEKLALPLSEASVILVSVLRKHSCENIWSADAEGESWSSPKPVGIMRWAPIFLTKTT